eukprot:1158542-Pelagomonas_calceolata.AAC.1
MDELRHGTGHFFVCFALLFLAPAQQIPRRTMCLDLVQHRNCSTSSAAYKNSAPHYASRQARFRDNIWCTYAKLPKNI